APKPAPPASAGRSTAASLGCPCVYLVYDERDAANASPGADFLFEQGIEVVCPAFKGDAAEVREYHEENLRTSDGVVLCLGAADELWLRRKLRELQKIAAYGRTKPAPVVVVCLLPPK